MTIKSKHKPEAVEVLKTFKAGDFTILPFDVRHDAAQPFGYLIKHKEIGKLLFVTDSYFVPSVFKDLSVIMCEANYDRSIIKENVEKGHLHKRVKDRVFSSHMEISTTIELIKANQTTNLNTVVLLHLSAGNSNEKEFVQRVKSSTGLPNVFVAKKGLIINLSKEPF